MPVLAFVGPLNNLESFHIVIEDSAIYLFDSVLDAVDLCFKFFYTADVQYPPIAHQLWTLIQIVFYQLRNKFDSIARNTEQLIADLTVNNNNNNYSCKL